MACTSRWTRSQDFPRMRGSAFVYILSIHMNIHVFELIILLLTEESWKGIRVHLLWWIAFHSRNWKEIKRVNHCSYFLPSCCLASTNIYLLTKCGQHEMSARSQRAWPVSRLICRRLLICTKKRGKKERINPFECKYSWINHVLFVNKVNSSFFFFLHFSWLWNFMYEKVGNNIGIIVKLFWWRKVNTVLKLSILSANTVQRKDLYL